MLYRGCSLDVRTTCARPEAIANVGLNTSWQLWQNRRAAKELRQVRPDVTFVGQVFTHDAERPLLGFVQHAHIQKNDYV